MSNTEMKKENLVERYLYDVTRRLPQKQRKDIEEELRTLIEDILEERKDNGKDDAENLEKVLEELGDPAKLAMKYWEGGEHLVGGDYFPLYCQILKIVLICVTAGMVLSTVVSFFVTAASEKADGVIRLVQDGFIDLAAIPSALLQAFGAVTLVFFLLEKNQVKLQKTDAVWKIQSLPQIPGKKAVISRGDSICGIVFGVLLSVLFLCAPEFMGAWIKNESGEMVAVSIFNLSIWNKIVPLFVISFLLGVAEDFVKLIVGYYNKTVMYVSIFCNLAGIIVTVYLFQAFEIFNKDFVNEISSLTGRTFAASHDIMVYWNTGIGGRSLSDIFMVIICLCMVVEMAVTVYRTIRYGLREK